MGALDDDIARARELLEPLSATEGAIAHRKMFGGASLYIDGAIFAVIVGGELMLKADDALGGEIEAAGGERWTYVGPKKTSRMPYWTLPPDALDDPDGASAWALRSLAVVRRGAR